jgi:transposase
MRVFCQDESRLGLHLPLRRRVTEYGMKPLQVVEPLYEAYWLYAAVESTTGDAFWWEFSSLDAECFTIFLRHFGQHYAGSLHLILLDQALAHVAQRVQCPDHVILLWFPAYSPELNPVERLWEDLKARIDVFDRRIRASLAMLQDHVANIVRRYTSETIASLTGYADLVEAVRAL